MLKVAITGGTGLIGSRVVELLRNDFSFIPLSGADFDITKNEKLVKNLRAVDFDILLHLAGYTNVDLAEKERKLVYNVNVVGTKNIFDIVMSKKKKLIYISTDYVFDGTNPPYYEDGSPHPLGYYAQTKYEGEQIVKDQAMIIRTSYPYGLSPSPKADFVRKILESLNHRMPLLMTTDSLMTPTYIDDFAFSTKYLLNHYAPETFHIVGPESLSPYKAAKLICRTFGKDESLIRETTFEEYARGKAPRSQFSVIKSKKNNFYPMKTFEQGLTDLYNKSL